eukprot:PITA_03282
MKQEALDMIFIHETKCSIQKIKEIYRKWLNRFEFLEVKAENTTGGILTLWNPQNIGIIDSEASRNYSVVIQHVGDREIYLVTNVYGPQRMDDKLRFIDSLMDLKARYADIPWILSGDFNMIKSLSEKKGGTRNISKDSLAFQNFMDSMKLVDIVSSNGLFTWNNKRGESLVASKLDEFIISKDLMLNNKEMAASILPFGGSDHWPVQLEVKGIGTPRNRPFRFENIWLTHLNFINNISGKKAVENILQELNQTLIMVGFDKVGNEKVTTLQQEWENFCKQEEIFWRQKSRVKWLKEGERNTRFFHRSTLANRNHNGISSIKDERGKLLSSHEDIEAILV